MKKSPRKKKIEKLEKLLRKYIIRRDKSYCQKCHKKVEGSNRHVSHVIPRSHGNVLRYDEQNLKVMCFHCHINWFHKNPLESAEWFKTKFPDRWKYLQKQKEKIVKFTDDDYDRMIDEYEDKLVGLDIKNGLI